MAVAAGNRSRSEAFDPKQQTGRGRGLVYREFSGGRFMSGLSIRNGEWVVVCDGAKALVLRNDGDAKFPNLKTVEVFEQKDARPMSRAPTRPAAS